MLKSEGTWELKKKNLLGLVSTGHHKWSGQNILAGTVDWNNLSAG